MGRRYDDGEISFRPSSRAVNHQGDVLISYVTKNGGKVAALAFMTKALKRQGGPETITTDGLQPPFAAMSEPGNADKQKNGRWANNSHRPF